MVSFFVSLIIDEIVILLGEQNVNEQATIFIEDDSYKCELDIHMKVGTSAVEGITFRRIAVFSVIPLMRYPSY